MAQTQAEQMLLEAIRAALRTEQTAWTDVSLEDWKALMQLAELHKLLPLVFDAVFGCPAAADWSDCEKYRKAAKQQMVLQTMKTAEFGTLYKTLLSAGVRPLVVKGLLCRELYPNGELRQSSDEDLIANDTEFDTCKEILQAEGYLLKAGESEEEISFFRPDSPLHLELHRSLFGKKSAATIRLEDLFPDYGRAITAYECFGIKVFSLSPHDQLLYLLLHAYKHFIRSGFGIRQVCDIGLWAQRYSAEIDWEKLLSQCKEVSAHKFAAAVFRVARKNLAIPLQLPSCWMNIQTQEEPLLEDLLCAGVYGNADMTRAHTASVTLNAVSAKQSKQGSSMLRTVFPPKTSLQNDYPALKEHGYLLPYVWVKRLLQYRKETKNAETGSAAQTIKLAQKRKKLLQTYDIL